LVRSSERQVEHADEHAPRPDNQSTGRTFLASERTFLAWLRTGVALIALGLASAQVGLRDPRLPLVVVMLLAVFLVASGVLCVVVGSLRHSHTINEAEFGRIRPARRSAFVVTGLIVAAGSIAMLVVVFIARDAAG